MLRSNNYLILQKPIKVHTFPFLILFLSPLLSLYNKKQPTRKYQFDRAFNYNFEVSLVE